MTGGSNAVNEASKPWTNAFDGDSSTYGALKTSSSSGDRVVFDTAGLTATRITLYGQVPSNAGIEIVVNDSLTGATGRLQAGGSPFAGEVFIDFGSPTAINNIGWQVIANGSGPKGAYWIKAMTLLLMLERSGH